MSRFRLFIGTTYRLAGTRTGDLNATETGPDTAALTGAVAVSGTLAVTETGGDTAALTGTTIPPVKLSAGNASLVTNWSSASGAATSSAITIAAAPNQYLIVSGFGRGSTLPAKPTISTSAPALTWTEIAVGTYTVSNPRLHGVAWVADISAGITSKTITINAGVVPTAGAATLWTDIDPSAGFANTTSGGSATGDPTPTLATIASGSSVYCAVYAGNAGGDTPFTTWPTGYTKGLDVSVSTGTQLAVGWDTIDPSASLVFASANDNTLALAVELAAREVDFGNPVVAASTNTKAGTTATATVSEAVPAGSLVVVCVASDNNGTTDAAGQDNIASVTDNAGNTYTFAAGYRNGQGTAQTGAHASIWYSVISNALTTSNTITVTNTTSGYARAVHVSQFELLPGSTVEVQSSIGAAGDAGTDPSAALASLPAATEYLFIGAAADENNVALTTAPGFTTAGVTNTTGGSAVTNMAVGSYWSRQTVTAKTFTPATAVDAAAVLVAFKLGIPSVMAALVATETGSDVAAISGELGLVPVTGTLIVQETGSDTPAFAGTLGPLPITGTLAATETGSDTAALVGAVRVTGTLAVTEVGSDTAVLTGTVPIAGTLVTTETGSDTAVITGQVPRTGTLAATETGPDTATIIGTVRVTGTLAVTETGADTAALSGTVPISATLGATEVGTDTAAIGGAVAIAGTLAAVEVGADTAVFAGGAQPSISGVLIATETGSDTAALTGSLGMLGIGAVLATQEAGPDTASIVGSVTVPINGTLIAQETGSDTAVIVGDILQDITGSLAAQEIGSDSAAFIGSVEGAVIEPPRDRLGTSATRFEERRHRPRRQERLTLTKPLTEEQIRQRKDKVHEKRRALWERPKPQPEKPTVLEVTEPPRAFISGDPGELERAKTAVSLAKARIELAEIRKQREEQVADTDRQQRATRLRRKSEQAARLREVLVDLERRTKAAEEERIRVEALHKGNQEAVIALLLAA